jgi:hypothetical protein
MSRLPEENIDPYNVARGGMWDSQRLIMAKQEQLKRQQGEAEVMSRLTASPEWEIYGRKLEFELNRAKQLRARLENALLTQVLNPQDYIEAKVHQAGAKSMVEALEFSLNVAKTLIEKGEKAIAELTFMEARKE